MKEEKKIEIQLHNNVLSSLGFSSTYTSDPQDFNPSKVFVKDGFELIMPNSTLYDYYYFDENDNTIRVETLEQLKDLFFKKTGIELVQKRNE